jgi:FkbM family methyltransferase
MIHRKLKPAMYRTGLYAPARHVYRRINPAVRRERALSRVFYRGLIEPGDLCFDIGANVGQTTEALADCGARVISVEPNPLCIPVLEWQFGRNPRVTLVKKAVGAELGSDILNYNGTDSTASIRKDWLLANRTSAVVEVTTLDQLISEYGRPKLCKVDVEGFETEVFKGLNRPIPLIYFEVHRQEIHRAREVLSRLSHLGRIEAANLTDIDHSAWLFDRWVTLDVFSEQLEERVPGIANAVLKMTT